MRVEENKEDMLCYLSQLEEEIKILKNNIEEFKKILENVKTYYDVEKCKYFDIEKGLKMIELL